MDRNSEVAENGEEARTMRLARARAFASGVTDTRVDWFRILADLRYDGYTLSDVSYFTLIPRATLSMYKDRCQPSYHHGAALVAFWSAATGADPASAPTVKIVPRFIG